MSHAKQTLSVQSHLSSPLGDAEIEALLQLVYVEGGFTDPQVAITAFAAEAVRARGEILFIRQQDFLAGMVILVGPTDPGRVMADPGECEMHLLAVSPRCRGQGLGQLLIGAAMERARQSGHTRMLLWTQPPMQAAQRLYANAGFERVPERDFSKNSRDFLFYSHPL